VYSDWDGDRLYPYVTGDSAETNETGYGWKTVWDSEADAREFVDGYQQLLEYHNAEPVPERQNTFRIPDDEEYGDAFWIHHDGDTVTIVNAPSVEELSEIRDGAAPEATTPISTDTLAETESTDTPTDETDDGNSMDDETDDGNSMGTDTPTEEGDSPGFGAVAALLALVAAALLARRR
jgi:PGF-CTERM protein